MCLGETTETGELTQRDIAVILEVLTQKENRLSFVDGVGVSSIVMYETQTFAQLLQQLSRGGEDDALEDDILAGDAISQEFLRLKLWYHSEGADAIHVYAAALLELEQQVIAEGRKCRLDIGARQGAGRGLRTDKVFGCKIGRVYQSRVNGNATVRLGRICVNVEVS